MVSHDSSKVIKCGGNQGDPLVGRPVAAHVAGSIRRVTWLVGVVAASAGEWHVAIHVVEVVVDLRQSRTRDMSLTLGLDAREMFTADVDALESECE